MLVNYPNKSLTSYLRKYIHNKKEDTKDIEVCPVCGENQWKKVIRVGQKYLVCKSCGRVKRG